jgi:hypothetical protein
MAIENGLICTKRNHPRTIPYISMAFFGKVVSEKKISNEF